MLSCRSKVTSVVARLRTRRLRFVVASLVVLGFSLVGGLVVGTTPALADTACAAGTYSSTGLSTDTTPCTPAPPGSFVDTTGATAATLCPLGTFQPDSGQTSCVEAPPGSFVDTTGATLSSNG